MSEMLEHALAWARKGFRVFPLAPGTKIPPKGFNWKAHSTTDEAIIRDVWAETDYNIGVRTDEWAVVDVDIKDGKSGEASFLTLETKFGATTDTLTVQTWSGGWQRYYKPATPCGGRIGMLDGIDIKATGGYGIAPGSVITDKDGKVLGTYKLAVDVDVAELPPKLAAEIGAPKERKPREDRQVTETEADVAKAREWLLHSAPTSGTFKVACKLRDFGVTEETCFDLMTDVWNERRDVARELDHILARVENAYNYAQNTAGIESHETEFGSLAMPEPEFRPVLRPKSQWFWHGDPIDFDMQWLFYQKLPRTGTAMLVAPSGAGKTFLSVELARCLAADLEFFGTRPDERCGAILLAGEGVSGMGARLSVLGTEKLPIASRAVATLNDERSVIELGKELVEVAKEMEAKHGTRLGLIVIDTLAASGLLLNEIDNSECAKAVKCLETLSYGLDCLVLVTHHPPKKGTGARGGSALHAGFDTVFEIFPSESSTVRHVSCTKGRDAPTGDWGSFTLERHVLGKDTRGREVTTCTVSMGFEAKPKVLKEPVHYGRFTDSFGKARFEAEPQLGKDAPVPYDSLRKAFGDLVPITSSPASRAFKDCIAWGKEHGLITVHNDGTISDSRPVIESPTEPSD